MSEPLGLGTAGLGTAEGSEAGEHAVRHVAGNDSQSLTEADAAFVAAGTPEHTAPHVEDVDTWVRVTPLSADRFELRGTIDRETVELLRQNLALLGHQVRSGNMAEVLKRALAASVRGLEKRKFAATDRPRAAKPVAKPMAESSPRTPAPDPHYVPAPVRRAVWKRDGGRCTYVSPDGHRCECRRRLEYDHIVLACHGGKPTVENTRLRCQAHNQYTAEQALGVEFMRRKRERARERQAGVKPASERASDNVATTARRDWIVEARARARAARPLETREPDVASVLRKLGLRKEQALELARASDSIPEAPFEERVRVALSFYGASLAKPMRTVGAPSA